MLSLWIAGAFFVIAGGFAFGVPMMLFGPRVVIGRLSANPSGRLMLGSAATVAIALVLVPFSIDPLISAGEIAQMSAENLSSLSWRT
ncbi:MAG: hypothetical protein AAFS13_09590 [Pseudomonadota bacterium]